jgi:hypothetical protein
MPDDAIAIPNIEVISRSDVGAMIRCDGRSVWVGALQMPPGAHLPAAGSRGTITLYRAAARELGFLNKDSD